jgi:hypothetical protein
MKILHLDLRLCLTFIVVSYLDSIKDRPQLTHNSLSLPKPLKHVPHACGLVLHEYAVYSQDTASSPDS